MANATVELHIRLPIIFNITKKPGGLKLEEDIREHETLGALLSRLEAQNPVVFQHIYDREKGEIHPPVVTVVNGTTVRRSDAVVRELADGDKITWFMMYAGG